MTHDQQQAALERAAAPALAAIGEDKGRAPQWLRPLFDAAAELLFDADLSLERIQDAAELADPEVWTAASEVVGRAPWAYLRDARLETAAHLLLETEISISKIGALVGYDSRSSFRGTLSSFLGMPPSQYRRQGRRLLARAGPLPAGSERDDFWRKILDGELSDAEARELDAYLARLAPASDPPLPDAVSGDGARAARLRQSLAEGIVESFVPPEEEQIAALPFAEQRRLVRDAICFPDATLFELLSRLASEEALSSSGDPTGRQFSSSDPTGRRSIELALLAIDSLEANGMLETDPGTAALAWTRLARERWRAGDLAVAEQDLERAAVAGEGDDEELRLAWQAERRRVEVAFHWLRGRRLQGLGLAEAMVDAHRSAASGGGAPETHSAALVRALLLRSELRTAAAELEPSLAGERALLLGGALADVEEAHGLLATATGDLLPARLGCAAAGLWARLLVAAGNRGERLAGGAQVRRAAADLGAVAAPMLAWLDGHGSADPEPLWLEARASFAERGDELWAARVTLDLARLCLARRRPGEAAALASELASTLGAEAASAEDLAAIRPLGRAAPFAEVTVGDLESAEAVLKRLELERRTRRALDLAV